MRYSIRRQMTIVFIGLLAFILGAIFIVNAVFLERYYISNKTDDLVETYQFLNDTIGGQELDEDTSEYSTVLREMGAMTERMNLDILIIDRNGNPVLGTIKNEDPRFFSTFRSVYYGDENSTVIESNEEWVCFHGTESTGKYPGECSYSEPVPYLSWRIWHGVRRNTCMAVLQKDQQAYHGADRIVRSYGESEF